MSVVRQTRKPGKTSSIPRSSARLGKARKSLKFGSSSVQSIAIKEKYNYLVNSCTEYQYFHIFLCLKFYFSSPFFPVEPLHVANSLLSHYISYFLHPRISKSSFPSSRWIHAKASSKPGWRRLRGRSNSLIRKLGLPSLEVDVTPCS